MVQRDRGVPRAGVPARTRSPRAPTQRGRVPRRRARARAGDAGARRRLRPRAARARARASAGITVHGVDLSPDFVALARSAARPRICRPRSRCSTSATSPSTASSTPRSASARAGSGCSAAPTTTAIIERIADAVRPGGRSRGQRVLRRTSRCAGSRTARTSIPRTGVQPRGRDAPERGRRGDRSPTSGPPASPPVSWPCWRAAAGLEVDGGPGVTPGDYAIRPVDPRPPELLLLARCPRTR